MTLNSLLSAVYSRARDLASAAIIIAAMVSPSFIIMLQSVLDDLAYNYAGLGAKLPLPMRLIAGIWPEALKLIWASVVVLLFSALWLESHVQKVDSNQRSSYGLAERLALFILIVVIGIFLFELIWVYFAQARIYLPDDVFWKHMQKYHK